MVVSKKARCRIAGFDLSRIFPVRRFDFSNPGWDLTMNIAVFADKPIKDCCPDYLQLEKPFPHCSQKMPYVYAPCEGAIYCKEGSKSSKFAQKNPLRCYAIHSISGQSWLSMSSLHAGYFPKWRTWGTLSNSIYQLQHLHLTLQTFLHMLQNILR